jgi:hypothetical protein
MHINNHHQALRGNLYGFISIKITKIDIDSPRLTQFLAWDQLCYNNIGRSCDFNFYAHNQIKQTSIGAILYSHELFRRVNQAMILLRGSKIDFFPFKNI